MADIAPTRVHVLCVDDELDSADLTALCLERIDDRFVVETAMSAKAGYEYLKESDIDCVVSDCRMPDVDGITFFEIIQDEYPELPFVLFTGRGSASVADDASSRGVTEYLKKNTENRYQMLADQIRNAVKKHRTS